MLYTLYKVYRYTHIRGKKETDMIWTHLEDVGNMHGYICIYMYRKTIFKIFKVPSMHGKSMMTLTVSVPRFTNVCCNSYGIHHLVAHPAFITLTGPHAAGAAKPGIGLQSATSVKLSLPPEGFFCCLLHHWPLTKIQPERIVEKTKLKKKRKKHRNQKSQHQQQKSTAKVQLFPLPWAKDATRRTRWRMPLHSLLQPDQSLHRVIRQSESCSEDLFGIWKDF